MKCLVCGRVMLHRGTYFECPNIFCDYEEDIEDREAPVDRGREDVQAWRLNSRIFLRPAKAIGPV